MLTSATVIPMKPEKAIDPRIMRTRVMLLKALDSLLHEKNFDAITMQDIADRSTVNRGTIYAHFKDKFALLEALVRNDFGRALKQRMGDATTVTCVEGARQLILAVCDYLGGLMSCSEEHQRPFEPVVESTVRTVVRDFFLEGFRESNRLGTAAEAELRATAGSWAICGTVMQWSRARSTTPEEMAKAVLPLVSAGLLLQGERFMQEGLAPPLTRATEV